MDEGGISQNRRSRRSNLLMAATVEHCGRLREVTLRNLSAEGAMVEGDHELEQGAEVVFHKGELRVPGRVAWSAERRAGIQFATSVDPDLVLRYVPEPRPRIETVHKRPGFRALLPLDERPLSARRRRDRPPPRLAP